MNAVLTRWNAMEAEIAAREVLPCCGSQAWAVALAAGRPHAEEESLFRASDVVWRGLPEDAWMEAFASHPRIGKSHAPQATAESLRWSGEEQRAAMTPHEAVRVAIVEGNRRYEARFGRIFIVCASGRSAAEILAILEARLSNSDADELREAAEQQRQITQLRLRRWLEGA